MAPLIVSLALDVRRPVHRAMALGFTTGLVYFGGTLYWVITTMGRYGGLSIPIAAGVGVLFWAYLSLYVVLFAVLMRQAFLRFGVSGIWFAPPLWVATEWLRSTVATGFPWVPLGASQAAALPVAQLASVVGVFGLSGIVALVNTAAASVAITRRGSRWPALAAGLVVLTALAWGTWRLSRSELNGQGPPLRVGLVQGSVEQDQKYDPVHRGAITKRYVDLSRQLIGQGAQLVIWPESSTPFYFDEDALLAAPVRRLAAEARTPFIIGTDQIERTAGQADRYYNSAVAVGADGRTTGAYRKMHLVPFGEYVPLKRLLFFVGPLIQAVSDFSAGTSPTPLVAGGRRVSVAICYESVYPSIAQAFVEHGSQLLATITNDAWFGHSSAAYQHFGQGALRAIEQGRYVVRAANTGISGAVDPYGRVLAETPLFEPTGVLVDVRLLDGRTIYSRLGDIVVWGSMAASLALWPSRTGRRRTPAPTGQGETS